MQKSRWSPQHSEDDDTEGNQSEEVMQDNQSVNVFTKSDISQFESVEFDRQGNSPLDMNAGASEARENWNSTSVSPVELTDDPAIWLEMISQSVRDYLVKKGSPTIIVDFPQNESGSRFSKFHCKRKLPNGKIVDRPSWRSTDKDFCYYCKLFDNDAASGQTFIQD